MKTKSRAHLYVSAATHPGMRGKNNEDRYSVSCHSAGPDGQTPSLLAVLCDGIGGYAAGEVAAEMAIEIISRQVAAGDETKPLEVLRQALRSASEAIRAQAVAHEKQKSMGSTCVCAWVLGDRLYMTWVGDSRLHLLRGDEIRQLTTDHTWVQEAIEYGALTPEMARNHPHAHVIQRHLGSAEPPEPDFRLRLQAEESAEQMLANQGMQLQAGDLLLLCSDGLSDLVEAHEIQSLIRSEGREKGLQSLVDLANERGGHDNITILALEYPSQPISAVMPQMDQAKPVSWLLPCLISAALLFCLLVSIGLLVYWLTVH